MCEQITPKPPLFDWPVFVTLPERDPAPRDLPESPNRVPFGASRFLNVKFTEVLDVAYHIIFSLLRQSPRAGFCFSHQDSAEIIDASPAGCLEQIRLELPSGCDVRLFALAAHIGLTPHSFAEEAKLVSWLLRNGDIMSENIISELSTFELIKQLSGASDATFHMHLELHVSGQVSKFF